MADTDRKLVARVKKGDTQAFEQLVDRYEKIIFHSAYRIVGDREDAADVTQATFVKVFERIDSFNADYRFFSWIYRISVNEAFNFHKRNRQASALVVEPKSNQPGPYEDFRQQERCEHLERALADMTYEYRVVIVLKHLMLLSYKEIAEILDLPAKTVKSRLFTARQVLHRQLLEQGYNA